MREWIYGRNPVFEALKSSRRDIFSLKIARGVKQNARIDQILDLARQKNVQVQKTSKQDIDNIHSHTQGIALEVSAYPYTDLHTILSKANDAAEAPFLLILDALQDPQNLGTLLRTAEITGVHGVVLPKKNTALVTPAVVNASSGASEHLLIAQMNLASAIEHLKECDVWVYGLEGGEGSQSVQKTKLSGAIALVVGNEGAGIRRLVREKCDVLIRLPMRGAIESLNAATAGSIALYFAWQARDFSGAQFIDS